MLLINLLYLILSPFLSPHRSLVALSLILSLLLFKPAPLYILDEVDAALDLSHTQNIGQMLRTHFTHSQVRGAGTNVSLYYIVSEAKNSVSQSVKFSIQVCISDRNFYEIEFIFFDGGFAA